VRSLSKYDIHHSIGRKAQVLEDTYSTSQERDSGPSPTTHQDLGRRVPPEPTKAGILDGPEHCSVIVIQSMPHISPGLGYTVPMKAGDVAGVLAGQLVHTLIPRPDPSRMWMSDPQSPDGCDCVCNACVMDGPTVDKITASSQFGNQK
jgi:hypothetical protein